MKRCKDCKLDQHRWIPVSEKLPEKSDIVDIYMPLINNKTYFRGGLISDDLWWTELATYSRTKAVTHWRYRILPEPK